MPELLAPAGGPEQLRAAVAAGADAVYFGLDAFNARARANNFSREHVGSVVRYCHLHGLRSYVTLNVLIWESELEAALRLAVQAHQAGADALIVQDLGLIRMLHRCLPEQRLHASTQMAVATPEDIAVLARFGIKRVVLPRELPLQRIRACVQAAKQFDLECEVFVHGALCWALSGLCSFGFALEDRSGNRGTCAQCCRYQLSGGDRDKPFSLKDRAFLDHLDAVCETGVASLKIEGRLKDAGDIFAVVRAYKARLQGQRMGIPPSAFSRGTTAAPLERGFSQADLEGGQERSDTRLVSLDRAEGIAIIDSPQTLRPGHGFRFRLPNGASDGFLVIAAHRSGQHWRCVIRMDTDGPVVPPGTPLIMNADQQAVAEIHQAIAQVEALTPAPDPISLSCIFSGVPGEALKLRVQCGDGRVIQKEWEKLDHPRKSPLDETAIRASFGALGGTGFELRQCQLDFPVPVFLPQARLKELRRVLVAELAALPVPPSQEHPALKLWQQLATEGVFAQVSPEKPKDISAGPKAPEDANSQWWIEGLDLWSQELPTIPEHPQRSLRHPPYLPPSPHLAVLNIPVAANSLGVLDQAHRVGLPVIADRFLNAANSQAVRALSELGASAVVLCLETPTEEIDAIAKHSAPIPLIQAIGPKPIIAWSVHGLEGTYTRPKAPGEDLFLESWPQGLRVLRTKWQTEEPNEHCQSLVERG